MKKANQKISYIKRPFAKKSLVALPFGAAGLACCVVSLFISVRLQGNGGMDVAAWGVSSMVFSAVALVYGLMSFLEKEMNYILARAAAWLGGALLLFWACLVAVGLFS